MNPEVALLVDRPDLVDAVADALLPDWPDWVGPPDRAAVVCELRNRAQRTDIPLNLVAFIGRELTGTVSITRTSLPTHAHLTPWLSALWVAERHRRAGIGKALITACRAHAQRLGLSTLHAATASAKGLFRRDGWMEFDRVELAVHPGEAISLFRFEVGRTSPSGVS